jgi:hypothetical protein
MIDAPVSEVLESSASPLQEGPACQRATRFDKLVIAIHGIGSQRRSDTIRSVARRFGARNEPPLPVMPLGFFQIGKAGEVHVSQLDTSDPVLAGIGFAEVFWADIPRKVVKEDDTLEETKAWGASVVSRAHARYRSKVKDPCLTSEDFALAGGVIDEIVEGVTVMENLLVVAEKAGVFKFDLASLLRDYVGDVQLVTEFKFYREQIVYRFHSAMAQIVQRVQRRQPDHMPDIYIVAHSEGSVVSFLGLLQALSCYQVPDPGAAKRKTSTDWIQYVRGFMTIGSPIDKHIVLWPNMWEDWKPECHDGTQRRKLEQRIKWRNYYDYADPIGFRLDGVVKYLEHIQCEAFDFETTKPDATEKHNFGFSRYWLPGKAHNDYWDDPDVFGHFIDDVVLPQKTPVPPKSSAFTGIISTAIPYALSFLLHFVAVFILYKGVTASVDGVSLPKFHDLALQLGLLSILLMCITVAARLPRLVKTQGLRWHVAAVLCFSVGAAACWLWLPSSIAASWASHSQLWSASFGVSERDIGDAGLWVAAAIVAAAIVGVSGWILPRKPRSARRFLIGAGIALVLFIIINRLFLSPESTPTPVWPIALAGLAYVYLWWLGILVFDLAFIWHRYVRHSVASETLNAWNTGNDPAPKVTLCSLKDGRPKGSFGSREWFRHKLS